jgi:hypothetical protein
LSAGVRLAGHGLSVELPAGWEGRIVLRSPGGPVMHVASFPLRPSDGDFGAAATGRMRPGDAFAALLEFRDPAMIQPGVGLFAELGQPAPRPEEFSANQLQVTRRGQLGWQRFFTAEGRTSCLYAVVAPASAGVAPLVGALAGVLATIERSATGSAAP